MTADMSNFSSVIYCFATLKHNQRHHSPFSELKILTNGFSGETPQNNGSRILPDQQVPSHRRLSPYYHIVVHTATSFSHKYTISASKAAPFPHTSTAQKRRPGTQPPGVSQSPGQPQSRSAFSHVSLKRLSTSTQSPTPPDNGRTPSPPYGYPR